MKKITILFLCTLSIYLLSCKQSAKDETSNKKENAELSDDTVVTGKDNETDAGVNSTLSQAENVLLSLPEVEYVQKNIEKDTENAHGVAFMSDSIDIDKNVYYSFQVGYNNEERFETYYWIYINKNDTTDIRVMDIVSGDIIPINEWRESQK